MNRKQPDGVDIADLRALLEHPGWAIFVAEVDWLDADTGEALRTCRPDDLGRLQGRADGLRQAKGIPARMIAEFEANQRQQVKR